ncbi:kinetochore protein CHL4 like-domain-containing protein [Lipomyces arxii]|uniref:kinetochore protein CHL4 like-domain-containing protein n=1 Tax=Lipomyces arxii TaxID=56418 RepID=UPI0034CEB244
MDDANAAPASATIILKRISRDGLISLALGWLENVPLCRPHNVDATTPEEAAQHVLDLRDKYARYEGTNASRRDVWEQIVYVDWKNGLNVRQAADIDFQHVFEKPGWLRWSASKVTISGHERIVNFHAPVFMKKLRRMMSTLAECYVHITQHDSLPLMLVRIQFTQKTYFVAFPTSPVYVFHTAFTVPYTKLLRECIELSLSSPGYNATLEHTSLTTKSLESLVELRIKPRNSTALGGWSVYANDEVDVSPLASVEAVVYDRTQERESKRTRFDSSVLERVEFKVIEKEISVRILFEGTSVFEGLGRLAELDKIDETRMPGWVSGELGVSHGVIIDGHQRRSEMT